MNAVWPFISNKVALQVNQEWAGHPGREVDSILSFVFQSSCVPHFVRIQYGLFAVIKHKSELHHLDQTFTGKTDGSACRIDGLIWISVSGIRSHNRCARMRPATLYRAGCVAQRARGIPEHIHHDRTI